MNKNELMDKVHALYDSFKEIEPVPIEVEDEEGSQYTPPPALKIGLGDRVLVSNYAIHGNETAAVNAFFETPKYIMELLNEKQELYDRFVFYGVLVNPQGVAVSSRDYFFDECDKIEFNRGWEDLSLAHPIKKALAKFFEETFQKYDKNKIIGLSHHEYGTQLLRRPFFFPPRRVSRRYAREKNVELGNVIDNYVQNAVDFLRRNDIKCYGKGTSKNVKYSKKFRKAPYRLDTDRRQFGGTLDEFFIQKGVPCVSIETGCMFSSLIRDFKKRVRIHSLTDLAFIESLVHL